MKIMNVANVREIVFQSMTRLGRASLFERFSPETKATKSAVTSRLVIRNQESIYSR